MLFEFEKSYRDLKKKVQMLKTASSNSQAAYSSNKRTFSGLDKKMMIDQESEFSKKFQTVASSNKMANQKGIPFVTMNYNTSNVSFLTKHENPQFMYQNLPQLGPSDDRKKKQRPMSAKTPHPMPKFIKNDNSTPKLGNDEIVKANREVINEEDYKINIED
jgi:hypothetical protein